MALTGLHTNWEKGSYFEDRDYEIKKSENAGLLLGTDLSGLRPQFDGKTSIAIGYGFDLLQNDNSTINSYLTTANGQATTLTAADITLLNEARAKKKAGTATKAYLEGVKDQLSISLVSEPAATTLLQLKLSEYETALDAALGGHSQLEASQERAAIISLLYTMTAPTSAAISATIPSTIKAIQNDNRAEAWFEIRYNSNGGNSRSQGIANRRYIESDMFNLFDDGPLTVEGTKEVFRMYTKHRSEIDKYENNFPPPSSAYFSISAPVLQAKEYLVNKFGQSKTIDNIIVGAGLDSYAYLENWSIDKIDGTDGNDLIFGEKGSDILEGGTGEDVIYGGEGNDMITGGSGNDYLEGGAGNDIYYINTGDGTDTIEDKEGSNRVFINGRFIGDFVKQADGTYKTPDGLFTGVMQGTDFVVTEISTGTKAILNKDFQDGDFGIHLLDTPSDPEITNTIIVDEQYSGTIYDTPANDLIVGTSGDDGIIGGWHGGNDWVLGGDGSDAISTGAGIVEGGAGSDIIAGGHDDSVIKRQLFEKEVFACVGN